MNKILKAIEKEVSKMNIEDLKRLIKRYSAEHLSDDHYHANTLRDETGIPYIQSVCGSALTVITILGKNPGDEVLRKANSILANVNNFGYRIYKKLDVKVVFAYFKLYRELKLD